MRPRAAVFPFLIAAAGCLVILACRPASSTDADKTLRALFDREWEWELSQDPVWASSLGDRRWNDRLPDVSPEAYAARHAHREQVLRELGGVARDTLSPPSQIDFDIFKYQNELAVEGYKHLYHLIRTDTYAGVQNSEQMVDQLRFETVKDYDDWLARLDAFPAYIDQNVALMREGLSRNVLLPKVIMERVRNQLDAIATGRPEDSGFYRPFRTMPAEIGRTDGARLTAAGLERVKTRLQPAFARLRDFVDRNYLPASYDRVGWWQTSSGRAGYAYFARYHTTTDSTPEEIHDIGLREVARIRGEMERIRSEVGFSGTLGEFFRHLRTNRKFFHTSAEDLLTAYRAVTKRIDPELVKIVKTMPRLPYGVAPIPEAVAPNTTTAYANYGAADGSRAAYVFVNLYKPETRPIWEMLPLMLHEGMPGHCLQGSIAQELGDMPAFRRHAGFTAYVEGWGLYAESLGDEMGLYQNDPYSKFGQLTYQMWRAVRLVVDTGMHLMQWDRHRAIKYFMDNAAKTELDVTNEIDRYISWPGQALAYKVGELKILELRGKARSALGGRFDLREFNDVVLQTGAVPLNVLDARVTAWIETRTAASP
jgi:uncharacterized protein (DUF885 family)